MSNEFIFEVPLSEHTHLVGKEIVGSLERPFEQVSDPSAYVVSGSVAAFDGSLSKEQIGDVQDSLLFAQLAANAKYNRENETNQWYNVYTDILQDLGWIIQGFTFKKVDVGASSFKIDKVALKALADIVTGNGLNILKSTMDALSQLDEGSDQLTVLETNSSLGQNGTFQISSIELDQASMSPVIYMGAYYYKASKKQKKFLFVTWNRKIINFFAGVQSMTLNQSIFDTMRNSVKKRLEKYYEAHLVDIPLSN